MPLKTTKAVKKTAKKVATKVATTLTADQYKFTLQELKDLSPCGAGWVYFLREYRRVKKIRTNLSYTTYEALEEYTATIGEIAECLKDHPDYWDWFLSAGDRMVPAQANLIREISQVAIKSIESANELVNKKFYGRFHAYDREIANLERQMNELRDKRRELYRERTTELENVPRVDPNVLSTIIVPTTLLKGINQVSQETQTRRQASPKKGPQKRSLGRKR